MKRIIALLASHNRREMTLRALEQLRSQAPVDTELLAVLIDCGSTDGTGSACAALGEWVTVVGESANCFWAEAMAKAERIAQGMKPDLLLWVNDDVDFDGDALPRLLETYVAESLTADVAVVGSMRDISGEVSYGGIKFGSRISRWNAIGPSAVVQVAEATNGNFLICSSWFAKRVGGIDGSFGHSFADFDWSLRARAAGGKIIVAPGFFGTCDRNSLTGTYRDPTLAAKEQWKLIQSPKGLPAGANARFLARHGGWLWPVIWMKPYAKILLRWMTGK